jgi:hypothetical protein
VLNLYLATVEDEVGTFSEVVLAADHRMAAEILTDKFVAEDNLFEVTISRCVPNGVAGVLELEDEQHFVLVNAGGAVCR